MKNSFKSNLNNTAIFACILFLSVLCSSCASFHYRGGHTTVVAKQQPSQQKFFLSSFECAFFNEPSVHRINEVLMKLNPHRFEDSKEAIHFSATAKLPTKEETKRKTSAWGYWLTLGVLPYHRWIEATPAVEVRFFHNGEINELKGRIKVCHDYYASAYTPLGLIYWGDKTHYQGDAQAKGIGFQNIKKIREVEIIAIANEINALLDLFEATSNTSMTLELPTGEHVSNVRIQQFDTSLYITYDLAIRANIEVYVSFDNGMNYTGPLKHVTGAVGKGIFQGKDKIIVWNVTNEVGDIDYPKTMIKIVADPLW